MVCPAVTYIFISTRNGSGNKLTKHGALIQQLQSQTARDRVSRVHCTAPQEPAGGREAGRAYGKSLNVAGLFLYLKREAGNSAYFVGPWRRRSGLVHSSSTQGKPLMRLVIIIISLTSNI